jgi:hypothetical protein
VTARIRETDIILNQPLPNNDRNALRDLKTRAVDLDFARELFVEFGFCFFLTLYMQM